MKNRYDKIPEYKVIKSAMQQELTDKQIEYVTTEIKKAALENKHEVYIVLDSFNPNQKRKLKQILRSKEYHIKKDPNLHWSIVIVL
ncbi:hypothetical protein [Pediococcus acidilactici]|uniref:hypothetical protein n=1 Tax=Pediococcus acidilactici TaxID=1254 RepID=UPI0013223DAE|nr:hypothetical protein [Pediococcus acidilactici]KAF0336874.1 hypothetical protein GBO39_08285 [Pediococcus acidilactici]KAF0348479.1 hypothetical protein GBO45_07505 [Pediococcus acidilactici]KAF0384904.1 hypothetical protein GBO64_05200 [Pediococcus acidilactici]KAF0430004.1 hypothetical protein GBO87_05200 [Pediococcus acidilactici]KAF0438465.1 hypothetical protein GBO94_06585 [Pediococcus acidilactici]